MMESCLNHKPERVGSITVEDLRKDLFVEFSKLSRDSTLLEKEHLQVYLRVRPFSAAERSEGESQEIISIEPPDAVILKAPRASLTVRHSDRFGPQTAQRFQFTQVYGPETTQRQIFDGTTKSLVKEVLEGGNSLIFTYGVTNAGKTFTFLGPESDGGILPRSLNVIFNSIESRIYSQNNIKPHRCVDFTRLTKEQQDEEATNKRNLLSRFKDNVSQKTLSSMSSSSFSSFESFTSSETSVDSVCLDETSCVKFSVWVSFCEIYNECIHDLLDLVPNGSHRRSVLRIAQDVKGNAFVKDLKWFQVNSADEALKVVKIGRKNLSFSSTKLNNISSRSHSIFSIRVLRIEDVGVPRVQTISELSLCDLAGSERCAKTQNHGDRLKEAGNINTSLLTLGKCINALRFNQMQSKFQRHVPFRESKLTHFLQGFFCGRGKACMIININQCASMYEETLNVLKFSGVAQEVVVPNSKPAPNVLLKKSARDVSMIINNVDKKDWTRRSSLMGWEMSLEDVQEDEDDEEIGEEDVESCSESMEDNTVLEAAESQELCELQVEIEELKEKLSKEESEKLTMESRIREEVTTEFMELFSNMEKDYNERLQREKEILEERAERRLEILKNLVNRTIGEMATVSTDESAAKEAQIELLDSMMEAMRDDLAKIKGDTEAVHMCLMNVPESPETVSHLSTQLEEMKEELLKSQQLLSLKTKEFEAIYVQAQESNDQLLQANRNYETQKIRCQELMSICQEKDDMVSTLQTALDQNVEEATKDRALINNIKEEILHLRNNCKCLLNEDSEPRGEEMTSQEIQQILQDLKVKDEQLNELKLENCSLEKTVCDLSDRLAELTQEHEVTMEMKRAEISKVTNENKVINNELHVLQQSANEMSTKLKTIQMELITQTKMVSDLSEKLVAARALIEEHQAESCSKSKTIESLMMDADHLRQELADCQISHDKKEDECKRMVELSQDKSRQINDLEQEVSQTRVNVCQLEELCSRLKYEQDAQAQEFQSLLSRYEAQKFIMDQIKSNSELLEELTALKDQQARMQEQDYRDDCWKTLQDKLIQTLSKLNQNEEVLNVVRAIVENDISKARDEVKRKITTMEKDLYHKDAELETKAQELLKSRELVTDHLNKIKTMHCNLQQVESERSDVSDQLCKANLQKEQLEKQILILSEENKIILQRLCEAEIRNQAGHTLSCTEQTIDPLQTVQSTNHAIEEENIQPLNATCQEICSKQQDVYQKPSVGLFNKPKQEKPRHAESTKQADDKQGKGLDGAAMEEEERVSQARRQLEGNQWDRLQLELEMLKHTLAEKEDTIVQLQREKCGFAASLQSATQKVDSSKQTSNLTTMNEGDLFSPTQEVAVLDSSVLSTTSLRDEHFPKPELEINFTPLKPDRINVRKLGDESVTIKLRSTVRKRKNPEMQNSESENQNDRRLKVNNRDNILSVETPTVKGKKVTQLKQKDTPASLKGKKDDGLQKIGDFIQSSPTLFGSKAKKIMVNVKSLELPNATENNKPKRSKRKLFKTQVSSPLYISSHPVIGSSEDDKESDHLIIKRKLRTRTAKR